MVGSCAPIEFTDDYICICKPRFTGRVCEFLKSEMTDSTTISTSTSKSSAWAFTKIATSKTNSAISNPTSNLFTVESFASIYHQDILRGTTSSTSILTNASSKEPTEQLNIKIMSNPIC